MTLSLAAVGDLARKLTSPRFCLNYFILLMILGWLSVGLLFFRHHFSHQVKKAFALHAFGHICFTLLCFIFSLAALLGILLPQPNLTSPSFPQTQPQLFDPNHPLEIIFDRPISQEIIPRIQPQIEGFWKYRSGAFGPLFSDRLIFVPQNPSLNGQEYTITLARVMPYAWFHLKSQTQSFLFTWQTPINQTDPKSASSPNLQLVKLDPADQAINIDTTAPIYLTFNQPPTKDPINFVTFKPAITFESNLEDNLLTLTPETPLDYQTQYHLLIPELNFQTSFTTAAETFRLPVPLLKQHFKFSCYAAASQMVLAYYQAPSLTETEIVETIGYDPTPRKIIGNIWGDPDTGVVGTIDGSGDGGYGVHWQPVADFIGKFRSVSVQRQWSLSALLTEVNQGYPVMVWWVNGVWPAKNLSWNSAIGKEVRAVNGLHVEVVTGYVGSLNHPDYILTNDPWRGQRRYTPETFTSLWSWFDQTAVVIR